MSWRIRSVRARILLLVLVPVLSLFGLYLFTTGIAGKDALNLARARALKAATSQPVSNFLGQLDTERVYALIYLSAPGPGNLAQLQAQEAGTARVTAALRAALMAGSTLSNAPPGVRQASTALLHDAAGLPGLHSSIAARTVTRDQALAAYNTLIGDSYLLLHHVILTETSTPIVAQALALERIAKSGELLQQENVLLVADLAARRFPVADQHTFTKLAGARALLYQQTLPELDAGNLAFYHSDVSPAAYAALTSLENAVIGARPPRLPAVPPGAWQRAIQGVSLGLDRAGTQAASALDQQAENQARFTDLRLLLSGGLGLLAVVASIIVSLLAGRGLVRELSGLRRSALDLANERLPRMVDQLAVGLNVDLGEDWLAVPVKTREIGQVRDAFAKVQRTAVDAAVGQARLREGVGEVFRNLARRSQSLLHRQLALLDRMERTTEDPQELEDLFRIDHLTTRMRRHAESLIILSGQSPARGWRNPVPFVDVLRAAVAEVEDYTGVSVICGTDTGLAGPAVGDVIHMIAELVENATIFSPPNTPVVIQGGAVGQGFAVEIEDRGLGMNDGQLASANGKLADPVPFDPANTGQLGLLVAGQLARRHDIQITLRPNPYGGTSAIVLIPHSVVVAEGFDVAGEVKALEGPAPATGRHATRNGNGSPPGGEAYAALPAAAPRSAGVPGRHGSRLPHGSPVPSLGSAPLHSEPLRSPPLGSQPLRSEPLRSAPLGSVPLRSEPPGSPPLGSASLGSPPQGSAPLRSEPLRSPPLGSEPLASPPPAAPPFGPDTLATGPRPEAEPSSWPGDAPTEPDVLPRRVRQASLVPQLRDAQPPPGPGPTGGAMDPRPPGEVRATISAIQRGWERGRSVFDPAPAAGQGGPHEPG